LTNTLGLFRGFFFARRRYGGSARFSDRLADCRLFIVDTSRATVVGSRNVRGGSGCGSLALSADVSVWQQATLGSFQAASTTPGPWSSAHT